MMRELEQLRRKRVAVLVTEYRHNSHAEMIVGRLLGQFGHKPRLEVVSLYVDQFPPNDMSREVSRQYEIPIHATIEEAVCERTGGEKVDGVLLISEHGDYPWNEKRQKLYPRRRFFEDTFRAFDHCGLRVPVFSDKHLSYNYEEALWVYRELKRRGIPFLGGSSIPLVPHVPAYETDRLLDVREIAVVSWLGVESYGFHGMEVLQSLAERRAGGETGIVSVEALEGRSVWAATDRGELPEDLLLSALEAGRPERPGHPRDQVDVPAAFVVRYADGLKGYVFQLQRFVNEWSFAFRGAGVREVAARCESGQERPYAHFGELVKRIERLVLTGRSPVPPERTLLTTGMISKGMESLHTGIREETPQLAAVRYHPIDWEEDT